MRGNSAAGEGLSIRYVNQDYLEYETGERFQLILMIYVRFLRTQPCPEKDDVEKVPRNSR